MGDDGGLTRRQYLTYGGAVADGGMLAGCIGGSNAETGGESGTNETDSGSDENGGSVRPYTVSMGPVGEVEFDAPPETWVEEELFDRERVAEIVTEQ